MFIETTIAGIDSMLFLPVATADAIINRSSSQVPSNQERGSEQVSLYIAPLGPS